MPKMYSLRGKLEKVSWKTARPDEPLDHRLQLLISSRMLARVREEAGRQGVSASELIRQLVHDGLERGPTKD